MEQAWDKSGTRANRSPPKKVTWLIEGSRGALSVYGFVRDEKDMCSLVVDTKDTDRQSSSTI